MTITYETLFEILRKEKNQDDLQQIDSNFFSEVAKYIEEKQKMFSEQPRLDQFTDKFEQEHTALRIQIQNIRKLVKDVFERRERKVAEMALNKAKTGSHIIDTGALLPEEHAFFEEQVRIISSFRNSVLNTALSAKKAAEMPPKEPEELSKQKDLNMAHSESNNKHTKVQITEAVPKFVGIDLEIYGPFNQAEEVELNQEIADMLVKTNKAKIIQE